MKPLKSYKKKFEEITGGCPATVNTIFSMAVDNPNVQTALSISPTTDFRTTYAWQCFVTALQSLM
jgi:hypothetical protein